MWQKVAQYCERHGLIEHGDRIVVGVSGGADSVCLLSVLCAMRGQYALHIEAVHVNHMLRGAAADADAAFTEKLCARFCVPCVVCCYPVEMLAKKKAMSLEEAGREARYALLARHARKIGASKIAVAHHMDDQAETVLMHLLRGTGLHGLAGMHPVRPLPQQNLPQQDLLQHSLLQKDLLIIRPLLCVTREEIEAYLAAEGLPFCEDATNGEDFYTRNKIRRHVLSYIKEEITPSAAEAICRSAALAAQADAYMRAQADAVLQTCASCTDGQVRIGLQPFLEQHPALQGYMVRSCMELQGMPLRDVTQRHIDAVCRLANGQTGKELALPAGRYAYKAYDALVLSCERQKHAPSTQNGASRQSGKREDGTGLAGQHIDIRQVPLGERRIYRSEINGETYAFTKKRYQKEEKIPNSTYTKWFDYDKINCQLLLRRRLPGDYLTVNAAGGTKKLKNYLIDCKCPAKERDGLSLLADGSHIMWVPGYRISEAYKITESTKVVLVVTRTSGKGTKDE